MDKLTRHQENLDAAYEAAIDAGDREALETEALEDEILTDEETFQRVAAEYVRSTADSPIYGFFLQWAVDYLRRERTAAFKNGWAKDPLEVKP